MKKETFIKIMNEFEEIYNKKSKSTSELSDILGGHIDFLGGDVFELVVKLLHDSFPPHILENGETFSDIEWFVYDCRFGKAEFCDVIVRSEGDSKKYKITNASDLYDCMVNDYSNLKEVVSNG